MVDTNNKIIRLIPNKEPIMEKHKAINTPKEQVHSKVNTAKIHANKEIEAYRQAVKNFIEEIDSLVLFPTIGDLAEEMFIVNILESVVEPLLKGRKPYSISEETFREMRADMFKTLINKYIDNDDKDD